MVLLIFYEGVQGVRLRIGMRLAITSSEDGQIEL